MKDHKNCTAKPIEKPCDESELSHAWTAYLIVRGMGCPHCVVRVYNALLSINGVLQVSVPLGKAGVVLEQDIAVVVYDPRKVEPLDLVKAIDRAGRESGYEYTADVMSLVSLPEPVTD